ncbi:enhancer of rudimentary homolog [Oppia nitens]|uniref:enhancer of rudimentary homolog n=1 Tax=Oppia nitens TaxID=1686743 RepID=UPI0023DBE286|nr:enhancer of rudimentary homolog [Oppia nitens]
MATHVILLVQASTGETRRYTDYDCLNDALEGVCHMYEQHMKKQFPTETELFYDLSQLFEFVDHLTDLNFLVFQKTSHSYVPYTKEWIKEKLYIMLRQDSDRELAEQANCDNNNNTTEMVVN